MEISGKRRLDMKSEIIIGAGSHNPERVCPSCLHMTSDVRRGNLEHRMWLLSLVDTVVFTFVSHWPPDKLSWVLVLTV